MCGIVGVNLAGLGSVSNDLLNPLRRLEYRGYDSFGYALGDGNIRKDVGKISNHMNMMQDTSFRIGICHTRWATHGGSTQINAHPHFNQDQTIHVVHNGIIENNEQLRRSFERKGYAFLSETDTEIIPHYFDYYHLRKGLSVEQTIQRFFKDVEGTYAVLLSLKGDDKLYAFKKDSPLVLGVCPDRNIVASDIYSFIDKTNKAVFFNDKEYAVVCSLKYQFFNERGEPIEKEISEVQGELEGSMGDFPHYMIKEINEQPKMVARLLTSLATEQQKNVNIVADYIKEAKNIVFLACGTSYHASLVGGSLLEELGYNVYNVIASEFDNFHKVDKDTLIFAISQSGETMDVVAALKEAAKTGAKIVSMTNVPHSTIQRQSATSINIVAGQEVAVASTKVFTNQVVVLLELARVLGKNIDMLKLPEKLQATINANDETARYVAKKIRGQEHLFFLGRGIMYSVALEMALKLKEISYIHAEGIRAGELKHGSIALIDPDVHTPVIPLIPNGDLKMKSSSREVESRGAYVMPVTNDRDGVFVLEASSLVEFALTSVLVGQLLSYYTALEKGCDVDQPRNLAKSVTVL